MNVKEEIAKLSIGQAVTLTTGLIVSLSLIVLQGTLYVAWRQIEPGIEKRTLAAALALVLILLTISLIGVLALLFTVFRLRRAKTMSLRYGLYWDKERNPHCPNDEKPLYVVSVRDDPTQGAYDKLKCSACKSTFPIRDDLLGLMTLRDAKENMGADLRAGRLSD